MNRIAVIGAGVAVSIVSLLSAGEVYAQGTSTEQPFVSGGAIQVSLESGGYDIRRGLTTVYASHRTDARGSRSS